jgi:hypothetical protein
MADNVGYTPGSGATIAADDVGGVLYQRVKLTAGAENSATDISDAFPLPVSTQGFDLLRRIASLLKPLQQITGAGSNRLSVDVNNVVGGTIGTVSTVTTVTTVTTCSTVSNVAASTLTNIANVWGFDTAKAISRQAYNSGIRARL